MSSLPSLESGTDPSFDSREPQEQHSTVHRNFTSHPRRASSRALPKPLIPAIPKSYKPETTSTITVDMMDCEITSRCSALSSAVGSHPDTLIPLNSTFQRSSGLMISDTVVQEFEDHSQWIHDGIDTYRASPYGTFPSSYPGTF